MKTKWPDGTTFIRVAQNKKIKVTVGKDVYIKKNIGGFYVLSGNDLQYLIDIANKQEHQPANNRR